MPQRKYVYSRLWLPISAFGCLIGLIVLLVWKGEQIANYMFGLFSSAGRPFSLLLGAIFLLGAFVIIDRIAFFVLYRLNGRLCQESEEREGTGNVYAVFVRSAREFRATSSEGVYTDEIIDHAREVAIRDTLDGQELDWGRGLLQFLGAVAPTVGFIGTLVGLIRSFRELGLGGELMGVLEGLALSMTTSLLGAGISVVFLSAAWILGRARQRFEATLYRTIATAQESDHFGV